ncbi:MAG: Fe-S protein [Rheinheimera sp.]|uniref:DUF1289 domain-containing protein n=1 Tax=Arsukibacterium sp. UBA3155 TaxID=1946058 RepID=UPI000C8C7A80|nr:DUF1289 domain-containing protein [Arsukibacterium sp. UBA3155]MAD74285.1 Fe-S protein [Rheinheimera sp.]
MVESPCVRNCCLDQYERCLGCGRLLAEILEWHQASEQRKQQIVLLAHQRLAIKQARFTHPAANPSE